ncbi:MAG: DUF1289 domain-containing protein [Pararobbsia sp.]
MGLFDGTPSSADLARPSDCRSRRSSPPSSLAQTFGAIAFGLAHFRPDVRLHGVLANRVGSARHAAMVRDSLPAAIRWLGHVGAGCDFALPDRHLGLVQANEIADLEARLERAADAIGETLLAELPPPIEFVTAPGTDDTPPRHLAGRHIAIARDDAFSFIYPANLDLLESLGAQLSYFSPLADEPVPDDADALYLPGGYPELHAARLARHQRCAASIRAHARAGRRIVRGMRRHALSARYVDPAEDGRHDADARLLPGAATLGTRFVSLGMQRQDGVNGAMTGHTFHYSQLSTPLVPASHATHPVTGERGEAIFHHGFDHRELSARLLAVEPAFAASLFDDDAQKARERDTTTAHAAAQRAPAPPPPFVTTRLNPPDALTMTSPLETSIALAKTLEPVGSPCTDVCKLDAQSGYCQGCMRTRDEIKAWKTLPDADKLRGLRRAARTARECPGICAGHLAALTGRDRLHSI